MRLTITFTKRQKYLLAVLFITICCYLYFKLVYLPEGVRFAALGDEYNQRLSVLDAVNRKQERLKEIDEKINLLDAEIIKEKKVLSQPLFVPDMLMDLHRQASKYNVAIDNIAFTGAASSVKGELSEAKKDVNSTDSENPGALKDLTISFTFTSSYPNLLSFIRYFEEGERYSVVEFLDVNFSADVLTGSMSVKFLTLR
jgi:hypothetical protein